MQSVSLSLIRIDTDVTDADREILTDKEINEAIGLYKAINARNGAPSQMIGQQL